MREAERRPPPSPGAWPTITTSTLEAGPHNVFAIYSGDANFTGSTGTDIHTVSQSATTTTVTSFPDPSNAGDTVAFLAFVQPVAPGSGDPTGTVTFTVTDGVTTVTLTGTVDGDGVAAASSPLATAGVYTVTAVYGGDTNFTGSSDTDTQTVVGA
ncbi:Ig-like domain repeat protein [Streptomyces libani]